MFMSVTLTGISPPARNRWGWPLSALSIDGRRNHDLHSLSGGALGKLLHPTSDETAGGQFAHDQFLSRYLPPAAAVRADSTCAGDSWQATHPHLGPLSDETGGGSAACGARPTYLVRSPRSRFALGCRANRVALVRVDRD